MTKYSVRIVEQAESDLGELIRYIAENDSIASANHLLGKLLATVEALELYPHRGHFVPELLELGIKAHREVHFGPYRVIYEATGRNVLVMLIVDGRRKLQTILERRLLR